MCISFVQKGRIIYFGKNEDEIGEERTREMGRSKRICSEERLDEDFDIHVTLKVREFTHQTLLEFPVVLDDR